MTIEELEDLIRQTLYEILEPDYGLELSPEVEKDLKWSIRRQGLGGGIPLEGRGIRA